MKLARAADDHHWIAVWLLVIGGAFLGDVDHQSTFAGMLFGAGFVWLMLVD